MRTEKIILLVSIFYFTFSSCTSAYIFNQKYGKDELKEDVAVAQKTLEANHPSLYWYTPKDSIDKAFSDLQNNITDSLTEIEFKNRIASVISKIKCGHTSVHFSKQFAKQSPKYQYPLFPLSIKTWKDSMVVLNNVWRNDSVLKRGTIITSINNHSNKEILDTFFKTISTDGISDNYKSQVISLNFPAWYKTVLGTDSLYKIGYIDSLGKEAFVLVKPYIPGKQIINTKLITASSVKPKKPTRHQRKQASLLNKRIITIDSSISTAYIKLTTFSNGKLRKFFRQSFRQIKEKETKNIIIDLRENGGGKLSNYILLSKYLADTAFKVADTVSAKSINFKYGRYIKNWFPYWWSLHFTTRKMQDGRVHKRFLEKHYFKPKQTNHFSGNIYLLQGGYTFSAATMFISTIKTQKNVTVIGEETGGGNYGNSAMHILSVKLPNSKLQIKLPVFRTVIDSTRKKDGHGIMPHIELQPNSFAIQKGIDLKTEKAILLIKANKK
jgi:C-terminal processing protease CtpA/Prc